MSHSSGSRYIRNDTPSLPKEEQRALLFRESAGRCLLCGRRQEEVRDWSMAKIRHGGTGREVSVEGRAILCSHCVGDKHSLGIPEYAGTLSFGKRLAYWWRVKTALLSGRISPYKAGLLLEEFSLLRRGEPLKKDRRNPRSVGGSRSIDNIVTACSSCNGAKDNLTVDEFVATFPESKRQRYIKRVKRLAANYQLPEAKAKALLSFQTQHARKFRFRLFRRSPEGRLFDDPYGSGQDSFEYTTYAGDPRLQDLIVNILKNHFGLHDTSPPHRRHPLRSGLLPERTEGLPISTPSILTAVTPCPHFQNRPHLRGRGQLGLPGVHRILTILAQILCFVPFLL